jgi:DNA-binding PadR family transcriptional regulator
MTAMKTLRRDPAPLSQPALHILLALGGDAKHGYAIMQDIATESDGKIRLLPGTLYSTIKKLLADELLEEVDPPRGADSDDTRRRYYKVTKRGRFAAGAEMRRMALLVRMGRVFLG